MVPLAKFPCLDEYYSENGWIHLIPRPQKIFFPMSSEKMILNWLWLSVTRQAVVTILRNTINYRERKIYGKILRGSENTLESKRICSESFRVALILTGNLTDKIVSFETLPYRCVLENLPTCRGMGGYILRLSENTMSR